MDEDDEGEVPKSEGFDVLLSLIPALDMKKLRAAWENVSDASTKTIQKVEFVAFAMEHEAQPDTIKVVTAEVKAELG
jgi:hypothetical protein